MNSFNLEVNVSPESLKLGDRFGYQKHMYLAHPKTTGWTSGDLGNYVVKIGKFQTQVEPDVIFTVVKLNPRSVVLEFLGHEKFFPVDHNPVCVKLQTIQRRLAFSQNKKLELITLL